MNDRQTALPGPDPDLDDGTLEGTLERLVYASPETGWSVARLRLEGRRDPVTIVGNLHGAQPGETLRLTGSWERDAKYGHQFQIRGFLSVQPSTADGIRRFLGSGLVEGIGPAMAERLVDRFGLETLQVIDSEPERLTEVDGIGPVRSRRIREAYRDQGALRDTMIFLQSHGISPRLAARISKSYGAGAVATVRRNPFRLADDLFGVGFRTADGIASRLGFAATSPQRVAAGLLHTLGKAAEDGHLFLPDEQLIAAATGLLEVPVEAVREGLESLIVERRVVVESDGTGSERRVYLPDLHRHEVGIVEQLQRLLVAPTTAVEIRIDKAIEWFERREGLELARQQREAIRRGLIEPVLVITGGPGTGKTTLVRAITEILGRKQQRLQLAAPTGRAAKRLAEATGIEARTIHRLLEYDPRQHRFLRRRERPVEADLVIVDELSMVDSALMHLLLSAVPEGCRLVLLGDADQLPSVGPGRVLDDLIACRRIPVVPLTEIFRQARASRIVRSAHAINRGELPRLEDLGDASDFFFIERGEPDEILATVRHLVTERIPPRFGLDARRDIQVLTPMRRGLLGALNLNRHLQQLLNPSGAEIARNGESLRTGDRVMQIRNNYDLGVFNGDVGRIDQLNQDAETVSVTFGERQVVYELTDLAELTLAYASSVHKSQGSEYPCVVLPLHSQHYVMLQRNLLYTALTRARQLAIIVGTRGAVARAVKNHRPQQRYTRLAERLRDCLP